MTTRTHFKVIATRNKTPWGVIAIEQTGDIIFLAATAFLPSDVKKRGAIFDVSLGKKSSKRRVESAKKSFNAIGHCPKFLHMAVDTSKCNHVHSIKDALKRARLHTTFDKKQKRLILSL